MNCQYDDAFRYLVNIIWLMSVFSMQMDGERAIDCVANWHATCPRVTSGRTTEDLYSLHHLIKVPVEPATPDGPCRVWQEREYRLNVCWATNSTPFSTEVIYESFCRICYLLIFLPYVITKWQANENPRCLYGHDSLMCVCIRSPQIRKGLPSGILLTYLVRNLIYHKHNVSNKQWVPMETPSILFNK